jgi:hypothetical protein
LPRLYLLRGHLWRRFQAECQPHGDERLYERIAPIPCIRVGYRCGAEYVGDVTTEVYI